MRYVLGTKTKLLTPEQKQLAGKLKISDSFLTLLLSRGFCDEASIYKFLHPSINDFSSPFDIGGMKDAVARLKQAIQKRERVLIYGDYDCDGVTSTVMLTDWLTCAGADVMWYIPTRKEGYGMRGASPIGKEWFEQAAAWEAYCIGKTVEEIAATPLYARNESHTTCADVEELKTTCTITVGEFIEALEAAAAVAK